jgi:hypothetical protein
MVSISQARGITAMMHSVGLPMASAEMTVLSVALLVMSVLTAFFVRSARARKPAMAPVRVRASRQANRIY